MSDRASTFHSVWFARKLLIALWSIIAIACLSGSITAQADEDFLPPDVAFKFSSSEAAGQVVLRFGIADGYYMYRERFAFVAKGGGSPGHADATLGAAILPAGQVKFDETFQKNVETYRGVLSIRVPVEQAPGPFDLTVTSQGCADAGICYPPATHVVHVDGAALIKASNATGGNSGQSAIPGVAAGAQSSPTATGSTESTDSSDGASSQAQGFDRFYSQEYAQSVLEGHGLMSALAIFFVLGVALSLLPCSLPMIPILSAIIIGEGTMLNRRRGFALSLSYVLGMAVIYTAFGVAAALIGQSLGAWLQNPWVLGVFALMLVGFALSQFGLYELQLPQAWQNSVGRAAPRHPGGKFAAVFLTGAVSALVVGACLTAPLFGILAFIAQTGSVWFGGAALFFMALGIGVPLLVVGIGAGTLLPRAGRWMEGVKRCFGMLLLAVAGWIVVPIVPAWLSMLALALWLMLGAAGLGLFAQAPVAAKTIGHTFGRGLGALLAVLAVIQLIGLAAGSRDPLQPLQVFAGKAGGLTNTGAAATSIATPQFAAIGSSAQLNLALDHAGRPGMLDFYADWCVSCKEMEKFTYTDPRVRARLIQLNLLRADVTANNADDQDLLKRFALYGPPGIVLFDATGREIGRVVGYQPADTFLRSLDRFYGPATHAVPAT
jgi:thiol:disulfide interchange protein DsbD